MRILSGIQPSGVLHIGNYFGMMKPAVALQAEGEALYFIADYHALTSVRDPDALRENCRRVAVDFLACGLDPERATLFRHSDVPQVTELAWILSTVAPMGLLERAHSYKDKLARGLSATVGLFSYPVLMAADILIYDSDVVPVGKDQKQHIEMMREQYLKGGTGYGDFKKQLFDKLWEYFAPMRKRREEILADKSYIDSVLKKGASRANEIAEQVMKRVREAVGLR